MCSCWESGDHFFAFSKCLVLIDKALNDFTGRFIIKHLRNSREIVTAPFNNMQTLKLEAQPTNGFFCCRQSNVRRLHLASDYCRALFRYLNCGQRFDYRTLYSGRKLGGVANTWLTVAKNAFGGWALNVRVRMLLKGAVTRAAPSLSIARYKFWAYNLLVQRLNKSSKKIPKFHWLE